MDEMLEYIETRFRDHVRQKAPAEATVGQFIASIGVPEDQLDAFASYLQATAHDCILAGLAQGIPPSPADLVLEGVMIGLILGEWIEAQRG